MPKNTRVDAYKEGVKELLTQKFTLHTALSESEMSDPPEDKRDPWYRQYEQEHYNNPDSPGYHDNNVARVMAVQAGVPKAEFRVKALERLPLARTGTVIVFETTPWYKVPEELEGKTFVLVSRTGKSGNLWRGIGDGKGHSIPITPTTFNARYATEAEIEAFVTEVLASKQGLGLAKLFGKEKVMQDDEE